MFVAVVFRGHLEADSRVTVVTRYELRPCEPGVRVRSDLYNGTPDPNTLYLADGLFWGDNAAVPFVPGVGLGFRAPKLDLLDVASAWREWPFVAARTQATPDASYAVVPCDRTAERGVQRSDADRVGRAADHDAARRRHPLRALHHRDARARAGAGGRRGAARPGDAARRSRRP